MNAPHPIGVKREEATCANPLELTIIPQMRVAFSGSHRVGKSTLIEQVAQALPLYARVEEPYHLLEEDGYESEWPPSAEDFEAQLDRAVLEIERAGNDGAL